MMVASNKMWILFVYIVKGAEGYIFNQNGYNLRLLSIFCYFCCVLFLNLFGLPLDYCLLACCLVMTVDVFFNIFHYLNLLDGRVMVILQLIVNICLLNNI